MRGSDSAERTGGRRFEIIFNYFSLVGSFLLRMPVGEWRLLSTASRVRSQCTGVTREIFLMWQSLAIVICLLRKNALYYRLLHIQGQLKSDKIWMRATGQPATPVDIFPSTNFSVRTEEYSSSQKLTFNWSWKFERHTNTKLKIRNISVKRHL